MKKILLVLFLFLSFQANAATIPPCKVVEKFGEPLEIVKQQESFYPVCLNAIFSMFDASTKTPKWVAAIVKPMYLEQTVGRGKNFHSEKKLPKNIGPKASDYNNIKSKDGMSLSAGHMAPSADYVGDAQLEYETFSYANVVPQVQVCNNSGVWSSIEAWVRKSVLVYGDHYIMTGPVYTEPKFLVGSDIAVPDYLFKVVYNTKTNTAIGFMVPNKKLCKTTKEQYITDISLIEQKTNLKFFPKLKYKKTMQVWK
jgi:endonuclease G